MIKNIKTVSKAKHLTEKLLWPVALKSNSHCILIIRYQLSTTIIQHHQHPFWVALEILKLIWLKIFLFWMKKISLTVMNFRSKSSNC